MDLAVGFTKFYQEKYLDQEMKNRTRVFIYFLLLFCVVESYRGILMFFTRSTAMYLVSARLFFFF